MGFFSQDTWTSNRQPLSLVPQCGACGFYKHCTNPKLPVQGLGKKKILIVSEFPKDIEDQTGRILTGNEGGVVQQLVSSFGGNLKKDCWVTYAMICKPRRGPKDVSDREISYCRPNLLNTIKQLKPKVIILLGKWAVESVVRHVWKDEKTGDIAEWVGWNIPSQKLNAWVCPTYAPWFLLDKPNSAKDMIVRNHLRKAWKLAKGDYPWPDGVPNYDKLVKILYKPEEIKRQLLLYMVFNRPLAFDYETDRLRPNHPDSKIVCCSVSDGDTAIAYPWDKDTAQVTSWFLKSKTPKIGANIGFEERWTMQHLGHGVNNWVWDTVLGAHWLDCRRGITSVKFQSFIRLGVEDYDRQIHSMLQADGNYELNQVHKLSKLGLLGYCGKDSLFEAQIAFHQMKEGKYETRKV